MRKEKIFPITVEGRDKGKHFVLKEAPSRVAFEWGIDLLLLMARGGADLTNPNAGIAGVDATGPKVKAVIDDMLRRCVRIMPDPRTPQIVRALLDSGEDSDDIEEVATRGSLIREVSDLHVGFPLAAFLSTLTSTTETMSAASSTTETSPPSSAP